MGMQDRNEIVRVREIAPEIGVELKYATADNFIGRPFYTFRDAWLRRGTAEKLGRAQEILGAQGMRLLIWDAFRPAAAQFVLWEALPDEDFVANPHKGFSAHSRGNAVDVTLTDPEGRALPMPSGFDDARWKENRDSDALAHHRALQAAMRAAGFRPYEHEWWHFYDTDDYPVEKDFAPPED